jgi:two-component sensor histidine kinase
MILLRRQAAAARGRAEKMDAAEVGAMLEGCAQRVQAIALLHRMLGTTAGMHRLPLAGYLAELCGTLARAAGREGVVEFDHGGMSLDVPARTAAELGLIVTELVLNAVRHGQPDGICNVVVGCRVDEDGALTLMVSDDGGGLPQGFDPLRDAGIGLQVVRALSGRFTVVPQFDSSQNGLRVSLTIPAALLHESDSAP